jgi:membrane protease YdiL (CAAX protease family)
MPLPVPIFLFVVLTLPFFLNDIGFILATTTALWLSIDYLGKALVIGLIVALPALRFPVRLGSGWPRPAWLAIVGTIVISALSISGLAWIDGQAYDAETALQSFPPINQTWLIVFDLTVGLALTAIAEELVFRRLFLDTFSTRLRSTGLYLLSAAIFAAIHWSNGVGTVAGAFVVGLMLLWLTRRTASVLPAIAAHFLINLVLFWP